MTTTNPEIIDEVKETVEEVKLFSLAEVGKHNSNRSSWITIHNDVYDVTQFLNEVSLLQ